MSNCKKCGIYTPEFKNVIVEHRCIPQKNELDTLFGDPLKELDSLVSQAHKITQRLLQERENET